jgi:hypothetical protein
MVEGEITLPALPVRVESSPSRSVLAEGREDGWR